MSATSYAACDNHAGAPPGAQCSAKSGACGQCSLIARKTRALVAEGASAAIDRFSQRATVEGAAVAEYVFDPVSRRYAPASGSAPGAGAKLIKTAYNGVVSLPVTGEDMLVANVTFGTTKVQFAVYDSGNMSEALLSRLYLSSAHGISAFAHGVNHGLFHVARALPSASSRSADAAAANANAFYSVLCYYEMMFVAFGRVGILPRSHTIVSLTNIRFTNAFWSGFCMFFGNGGDSGGKVRPLTAMDVCGHELTHGLQTFSTEFEYLGESGALNESIADVFGTLLEFYVNSAVDVPDWTIGEAFNFIIRDFANPKKYGQPNFYRGAHWVDPSSQDDEGGVHTNSGVTNFMCYLAVQGCAAPFRNDAGALVGPITPPASFTLRDYALSVYDVLERSPPLSISASLGEFAVALTAAVAARCGAEAAAHVSRCAAAVGLAERAHPAAAAPAEPAESAPDKCEADEPKPAPRATATQLVGFARCVRGTAYGNAARLVGVPAQFDLELDPAEFEAAVRRAPVLAEFWTLEDCDADLETVANSRAPTKTHRVTAARTPFVFTFGSEVAAVVIVVTCAGAPDLNTRGSVSYARTSAAP